ncbi:MAG: hypothetical protein ACR2II_10615 [Chthoniobacterales bacterium]
MRRLSALSAILIGGAIAGALDITYAVGFSALHGVAPMRILQSVASGLLGAPAFEGGASTAALGLALHFCVALLWAAIFYLTSKALPFLTRYPVVGGLLYGILIYAVMNLVVLPLSAFPRKVSFPLLVLVTGILVHMFCIGLPISLAVRRTLPDGVRSK